MINVTVDEQKPQEVNQFPKLMTSKKGTIILVIDKGNIYYNVVVLKREGYVKPYIANDFDIQGTEKFTDFNDLVTLQNA